MDIPKFLINLKWLGKVTEDAKSFDKTVFNGNIDTCNVAKGIFGNFIIRSVAEIMKETSNFTFTCPQRKGFFYAKNFKAIDSDSPTSIPYHLLGITGKFEIYLTIKAKVPGSKTPIQIMSGKAIGTKV